MHFSMADALWAVESFDKAKKFTETRQTEWSCDKNPWVSQLPIERASPNESNPDFKFDGVHVRERLGGSGPLQFHRAIF